MGHVNACAGTTAPLLKRGHRVIFMVDQNFTGKLAPLGFEEHVYKLAIDNFSQKGSVTPGEDWAKSLLDRSIFGPDNTEQKWHKMMDFIVESAEAKSLIKQLNEQSKFAIDKFIPDLIVLDTPYLLPEVAYSGIPWIQNMSIVPQVFCMHDNISPACSGI